MLIDTHCHLDLEAFDADREEVWARARAVGVTRCVVPATTPAAWPRTAGCKVPGERSIALGIHPQYLSALSLDALSEGLSALSQALTTHGAVAVGECGFDGTLDLTRTPWDLQREVFMAHAEVARSHALPMVVHVLRAHETALDALRALGPMRGVIHSFSGSAELAAEYVRLGWHLGFGGALTRPNARKPAKALRATPHDRIVIETDAPDQVPTGAEGSRCEPAHLGYVAARAAEVLGLSIEDVARLTARNARSLFALE